MSKNKAESSSQVKNKLNNGPRKVSSSSKTEEAKKSREPSTDRNNLKKNLPTKKIESSRLKTETPKTVSKTTISKTNTKSVTKSEKLNPSITPRISTKPTIKPSKSSTSTSLSNSSKSTTNAPLKGTKSTSRDITSKRVTKEQYFPKKYPFSSYLHENEGTSDKKEQVTVAKTTKKVEKNDSEEKRSKLSIERTMTRTLNHSEVKAVKNIVDNSKIMCEVSRPRTATIRKHSVENSADNIEEKIEGNKDSVPQNEEVSSEYDYEDDFDSYESDFETYSSSTSVSNSEIESTSTSSESSFSFVDKKLTELVQKRVNSAGNEEERKLDSGNYDLPDVKHKQMLDKIKEAIEKENSNLNRVQSNLASLSDEGFEDGSKNSLGNSGFINFTEAKKKQQKKKIISKSKKRGVDLMGMIRLNSVSFSLFDMKAISYDEFMQSYGKSGTIQMSSQTGEDDIDEEVQTEIIENTNKSTQFPIRFSQFDDNPTQIISETDTNDSNFIHKLNKFMKTAGGLILHILEQKQLRIQQINKNERELPFSNGYYTLNFDSIPFIKNRNIFHMAYSKYSKLLTIHESNIQNDMDQDSQLLSRSSVCIWDISEPHYPENILVSSGEITKACFDCNYGFLIFAGISDGSICAWDLRENSKLHRSVFDEKTDQYHVLRSPTYTTVVKMEGEQNSAKIIAIQSFAEKLGNDTNQLSFQRNISGIQVATLDETGLIVLWSVIPKSPTPELLSEDPGLVPWGCIILVQGLTIDLQKLNTNLKELQCFDLQFSEEDFNHFYIASNYGVLHCLTSGMKPKPKIYSADKFCVNCVEMAPFSSTHFLCGCENGNIKLHSRFYEKPLMTLCSTEEQNKFQENIQLIEWSNRRPCVFFVKDRSNNIHIWDLTASDMFPIYSIPFKEEISDVKLISSNKPTQDCFLAIASKKYGVRVHIVSKEFSQISPDQYKTELNIFLNYANRL